jgi:uncharacterized protein (DUF2062 family)
MTCSLTVEHLVLIRLEYEIIFLIGDHCIMSESSTPIKQQAKKLWQLVAAPAMKRLQGVMTCGMTPKKLALTFCIGVAIGIMPLVWGTTLICLLFGHVFRLNQLALQSLNYLLYPVQLALLIPYLKLGAWLFPWGPTAPPNMFYSLFHSPGLDSLNLIAWVTLKSIAAWSVTALPLALFAYGMIRVTTRKRNEICL